MTLRTKLLAAFASLAAIALLVIAVGLFTSWRAQVASVEMETHFRRSLLLQGVRANTFQALKEVDDALTGDLADARGDFERALVPATRDFRAWAALADSHAERDEVARVRAAHEALVASGRRVFELAASDRSAAIRLADDEVDTKDFAAFRGITERAVGADRAIRRSISTQNARTRETAQIMLAISAISIFSLILLIAAYLSQDLFRPLRDLAAALDRMARGDWNARADSERGDEIGDVARAANRVAEAALARVAASPDEVGVRRPPLDLSWVTVDPPALLQAIAVRHGNAIHRRGIAIDYHFAPIERAILGDPAILGEAIDEALRHAFAALPDRGGRIGMRIYADDMARIEIADDGSGIDAVGTGDPMENGAGKFPLASAAAQRHGGELRTFSEVGRGNVTQISLPLQA
ncbi:MAG: HAMP domain-containing protein [Pseudomonadota bacterium]